MLHMREQSKPLICSVSEIRALPVQKFQYHTKRLSVHNNIGSSAPSFTVGLVQSTAACRWPRARSTGVMRRPRSRAGRRAWRRQAMASTAAVPTGHARAYAYVPGPASRRGEAGHECRARGGERRAAAAGAPLRWAAARGEPDGRAQPGRTHRGGVDRAARRR